MKAIAGFRGWPWWKKATSLARRPLRRAHRQFRSFPLRPYRTIMDVGAFEGEFTRLALDYLEPVNVWMIEANPEQASRLKTAFAHETSCRVINAAIAGITGEVRFHVSHHLPSSSLLPIQLASASHFGKDLSESKEVSVSGFRLDDLFVQQSIPAIDLMKVDIQGAERMLIEGGHHALEKVGVLCIEVLFEELYEGCALFGEIHALLLARGFHLHSLHGFRRGPAGFLLYGDAIYERISAPTPHD